MAEKHVSNKTGAVLYYMWMLPSKVMPYLLRLAAPLTDSSIVRNDFTDESDSLQMIL